MITVNNCVFVDSASHTGELCQSILGNAGTRVAALWLRPRFVSSLFPQIFDNQVYQTLPVHVQRRQFVNTAMSSYIGSIVPLP